MHFLGADMGFRAAIAAGHFHVVPARQDSCYQEVAEIVGPEPGDFIRRSLPIPCADRKYDVEGPLDRFAELVDDVALNGAIRGQVSCTRP